MGFYYGQSGPPPEEERRGCRDVLLLTRAAFGILLIPLAILFGALVAVAAIVYLFSRFWLLGVVAIGVVAALVYLYARWERTHFRGS